MADSWVAGSPADRHVGVNAESSHQTTASGMRQKASQDPDDCASLNLSRPVSSGLASRRTTSTGALTCHLIHQLEAKCLHPPRIQALHQRHQSEVVQLNGSLLQWRNGRPRHRHQALSHAVCPPSCWLLRLAMHAPFPHQSDKWQQLTLSCWKGSPISPWSGFQ